MTGNDRPEYLIYKPGPKQKDKPYSKGEIEDHSKKVAIRLDELRRESDIAWDESIHSTVCQKRQKEY